MENKPTGKPKRLARFKFDPSRNRQGCIQKALAHYTAPEGFKALCAWLRRLSKICGRWERRANRQGVESAAALYLAILDDLDLRTGQTRHNLAILAERAQLITTTANGESTHCASRAAKWLAKAGLIFISPSAYNPFDGLRECLQITITQTFFKPARIDAKAIEHARRRLLKLEAGDRVPSIWSPCLDALRESNFARMIAASLNRMKAKRERIRQAKHDFLITYKTPA